MPKATSTLQAWVQECLRFRYEGNLVALYGGASLRVTKVEIRVGRGACDNFTMLAVLSDAHGHSLTIEGSNPMPEVIT